MKNPFIIEQRRSMQRSSIILCLFLCLAVNFSFMQSDARYVAHRPRKNNHVQTSIKSSILERFGIAMQVLKDTSSNTQPYISSPLSMTPYQSLPPYPLPDNSPPAVCVTPPSTPQPPSPSGGFPPLPPLPPSSSTPVPPGGNPPSSPPETTPAPYPPSSSPTPPFIFPNPPTTAPSPPDYTPIAPPANVPSPPSYTPSPTIPIPSPPVFVPSPSLPPVVFPPPAVPSPPHSTPGKAMWCVAKPSVPEPIIQEAMNYACGSGADCDQIKPKGSCFQPDSVLAHASYAFNSYWQRTKASGGTCEFGGSAILVTVDPSYDGCRFIQF